MVVVGHSQGGLLTKLTAIDSGERFWERLFKVPIDQLDVAPESRELLRRSLYYKPLPFVHQSRLHLHASPRQPFVWRLYHRFAETSEFAAPYASQPAAGDFPKKPRGRHDKCDGG